MNNVTIQASQHFKCSKNFFIDVGAYAFLNFQMFLNCQVTMLSSVKLRN